jgi:hypothetical protein
VSNET